METQVQMVESVEKVAKESLIQRAQVLPLCMAPVVEARVIGRTVLAAPMPAAVVAPMQVAAPVSTELMRQVAVAVPVGEAELLVKQQVMADLGLLLFATLAAVFQKLLAINHSHRQFQHPQAPVRSPTAVPTLQLQQSIQRVV
jgi:hypothetical protein